MNRYPINSTPINGTLEALSPAPLPTLDGLGRSHLEPVWLLDLEVGGHVHRYSTRRVVVETVDGDELLYEEGLADPAVGWGDVAGTGEASVGVELQTDVDWSLSVAHGHALDQCPASLWRWRPGEVRERARLVLRGLTSAPVYGAQHEPMAVSIRRAPREQSSTLPPVQAVVDLTTWPTVGVPAYAIPDASLGAAYPLVIGCPGDDDGAIRAVVPVPLAGFRADPLVSRVVWLGGDAASVSVQVVQGDVETTATETVVPTSDLLGRRIEVAPVVVADSGGQFRIGFGAATGGGIRWRGELLRGAGDVIAWALTEHYSGRVDLGRLAAARSALNLYKIDTWINAPTVVWDWLQAEVLSLLPVELRESAEGIYPALLRWDLTERDAVAHLEAPRVEREGAIGLDAVSIANEITVEYRPLADSGARWLGRHVLTSTAAIGSASSASGGVRVVRDSSLLATDVRVQGHPACTKSQRRYGLRPLRIQAEAVWDTATAVRIASDAAARLALPRRTARYVGGHHLEALEVGQAVTLTDAELHLDRIVCLVVDVAPVAGGTALDLVLLR